MKLGIATLFVWVGVGLFLWGGELKLIVTLNDYQFPTSLSGWVLVFVLLVIQTWLTSLSSNYATPFLKWTIRSIKLAGGLVMLPVWWLAITLAGMAERADYLISRPWFKIGLGHPEHYYYQRYIETWSEINNGKKPLVTPKELHSFKEAVTQGKQDGLEFLHRSVQAVKVEELPPDNTWSWLGLFAVGSIVLLGAGLVWYSYRVTKLEQETQDMKKKLEEFLASRGGDDQDKSPTLGEFLASRGGDDQDKSPNPSLNEWLRNAAESLNLPSTQRKQERLFSDMLKELGPKKELPPPATLNTEFLSKLQSKGANITVNNGVIRGLPIDIGDDDDVKVIDSPYHSEDDSFGVCDSPYYSEGELDEFNAWYNRPGAENCQRKPTEKILEEYFDWQNREEAENCQKLSEVTASEDYVSFEPTAIENKVGLIEATLDRLNQLVSTVLQPDINDLTVSQKSLIASHTDLGECYEDLGERHDALQANHLALGGLHDKLGQAHYNLEAKHDKLKINVDNLQAGYKDMVKDSMQLESKANRVSIIADTLVSINKRNVQAIERLEEAHAALEARHGQLYDQVNSAVKQTMKGRKGRE